MSPLEREIRAIVDARLAELGITSSASGATYSRENLPPGFRSPESFAAECRRLHLAPSLYRPGRAWKVPADVWAQARRDDRERRRGPAAPSGVDPIDATLEKAGLRLVRGRT
jgi:hypothetical protein